MRKAPLWTGSLLLTLLLSTTPVLAEKPEKNHPEKPAKATQGAPDKVPQAERGEKPDLKKSDRTSVELLPALPKRDRDLIRDYIRVEGVPGYDRYPGQSGQRKDLPPGLQKKMARGGSLPPGWRDKVVRGEVLPSEFRQYAYPLPADLYDRLGYSRTGIEFLVLEDRLVRLAEGRGTVLDVIDITDIMLR